MREIMLDSAGLAVPARYALDGRSLRPRRRLIMCDKPVSTRHLGHSAKQSLFGPRAHQQLVAARDDARSAAPQCAGLFRRLVRECLLFAAHARDAIIV